MTTMSFNAASNVTFFAPARSPHRSFAARLAALQAKQERALQLRDFIGAAGRTAIAAVPFCALAYIFVAI